MKKQLVPIILFLVVCGSYWSRKPESVLTEPEPVCTRCGKLITECRSSHFENIVIEEQPTKKKPKLSKEDLEDLAEIACEFEAMAARLKERGIDVMDDYWKWKEDSNAQ